MGMVQTLKIQLTLTQPDRLKELSNLQKTANKIANSIMSKVYMQVIVQRAEAEAKGEKFRPKIEMRAFYDATKDFSEVPSVYRAGIAAFVRKKFASEIRDVVKSNRTPSTFRDNLPLYFASQATNKNRNFLEECGSEYLISIGGFDFVTYLGRKGDYLRQWIVKIKANQAKFCDSSLIVRGGKIFLLCSVKFAVNPIGLNPEIVCGIDMGIATPLVCGIPSSEAREYIGTPDIIQTRDIFRKRRSLIQKAMTYTNGGGHGRKRKLEKLNKIGKKERDYVNTLFHAYSSQAVKFAIQNGCGTIKMEDLSSIRDKDKALTQSWGYYDLQKKIEYKAVRAGINVKYINPKNTSLCCSQCGNISKSNRKSQSDFTCENCGYSANADYNASLNIAKKDS